MIGLFFIVLAQVVYAFGGLIIRKYLEHYNPILVSALMAMISAFLFIPILLIFFRSELGGLTFKNLSLFVLASIFWLVIAEVLYVAGFQKAPSLSLASLMTLFYPLFSTILGIIFLKESLTLKTILAGGLMVLGFVLLAIK